jgi:hypothetical protein
MLAMFKSAGPAVNACRAHSQALSRHVRSSRSQATVPLAPSSARPPPAPDGPASISRARAVLAERAAVRHPRRPRVKVLALARLDAVWLPQRVTLGYGAALGVAGSHDPSIDPLRHGHVRRYQTYRGNREPLRELRSPARRQCNPSRRRSCVRLHLRLAFATVAAVAACGVISSSFSTWSDSLRVSKGAKTALSNHHFNHHLSATRLDDSRHPTTVCSCLCSDLPMRLGG